MSPKPTADSQSPGGLPPELALGCGLTSVRGNKGEIYKNEVLVRQKHIKKKKFNIQARLFTLQCTLHGVEYAGLL